MFISQRNDRASLQQDEQHNNVNNQGRSSSLICVYPRKDRNAAGNGNEDSWEMGENLHHIMFCMYETQTGGWGGGASAFRKWKIEMI